MPYRIKTICELTGIPKSTLLAWERRYGLISPVRAGNSYREYSDADLKRIREVKALIDRGYKVSEAMSMEAEPPPAPETHSALFIALMAMDHAEARTVLDRHFSWSYSDLIRRLFFPVLREVGAAWAAGRISIAQEHFATTFVREQMAAMLVRLGYGPADGPHALVATIAGDHHSLGAKAMAVELALRGWRVTFLGADTPSDALIEQVQRRPPMLICLCYLLSGSAERALSAAKLLRRYAPEHCLIILGGPAATPDEPQLAGLLRMGRLSEGLEAAQEHRRRLLGSRREDPEAPQ